MNTTTEFTTEWHLERSRPEQLLSYLDLSRPFIGQINRLVTRFRDVQFLCEHGERPEALFHLRDALAFHLVKMSRWWNFDFCPRSTLEIQAPRFLAHVRAHTERSIEDDTFYDLFTLQRHLHGGDARTILILGHDPEPRMAEILYGVDGQRRFRLAHALRGCAPTWEEASWPDFAEAWLAARTLRARNAGDREAARDASLAQAEHERARSWHQRHFHACCERHIFALYREASAELLQHRSAHGRLEGEAIINSLAFRVARQAVQSRLTVRDLMRETGCCGSNACPEAVEIERRARMHVFISVDETRQTVQLAIVDRLGSHPCRED
ncbi:hypothetical protein AA0472_0250 [Acetobacter estunensis NRIC 0472]|uniref:Uncharacterized protein n=1 Tax=Acetobacter estunensis TaxID=104097 RepID=A0A967B752_9PROT|nr:hypothetical protein [Acetobacter estunensis]NHO54118.1 hypothetical protein [Acetobacter estunensis]GBQ20808.1 hypothetical protein AA0472_0250 [Acetobacter estunensis NRIC 0472]